MRIHVGLVLGMLLAACFPGAAAAQQSAATGDPVDCTKLQGLDAQMACLKKHVDGLKAMSAGGPAVKPLPPGEPRIVGDRNQAACHAKGQAQALWPNGQPMGPATTMDQCVENHGVAQADFVEYCEAGMAVLGQAGRSNVVLRYMPKCPAKPKSKCSLKKLPRAGGNENDPATYTARVDFLYYPADDQQAGAPSCTDKQFF